MRVRKPRRLRVVEEREGDNWWACWRGKTPSCSGTYVCAGKVRGVAVDVVERHITCPISHGDVLVCSNIMEQLGAGAGRVLGCLALLGSDSV